MDELVKSALLGTAKKSPVPCDDQSPTDRLALQLQDDSVEKVLLLRAGARSVAETAGFQPLAVPPLDPAPLDAGTPPSEEVAALLEPVLSSAAIPLLPEFVTLLQEHRLAFPHRLLPAALSLQDARRRELLRGVLGPRAHWLAQFHAEWNWIDSEQTFTDEVQQRLKEVWDDGTLNERALALRELRTLAPDAGRHWLELDFSQEKGDSRRRLLEQFEVGLSLADEPFLESLRRDRSKKVQEVVLSLLGQISGSQLCQRMSARGKTLLQLNVSETGAISFDCLPAAEFSAEEEADGLNLAAHSGMGPRSGVTRELISRIPPHFWVRHFERSPAELIELARSNEFAPAILTGWLDAVARFKHEPTSAAWHRPLWDALALSIRERERSFADTSAPLAVLAPLMSPADLDAGLLFLLGAIADITDVDFATLFAELPASWSPELSARYLQKTRKLFQSRIDAAAGKWCLTLLPAATGLSPDCFAAALEPWSVAADTSGVWRGARLETQLQRFGEVIRVRHQFRQAVTKGVSQKG